VFGNQINTIASTLSFNVKTHVTLAGIRHYDSALSAALTPHNIPVSVYDSLIESVNANLPLMHRYMDIRGRLLGLNKLGMYDILVPLFQIRNEKLSYDKAIGMMYEALAPLGKAYIDQVKEGVNSGWIDVYENKGKRSGAYSGGSYDSHPFILLNYSGRLDDLFTIVHEMGHSMHSYYSNKSQPFRYAGYSIFAAETASTVNENLLIDYLMNTMKGREEQRYLLGQYLETFRATIYRQTMFAEFEKLIHEIAWSGQALTAELMNDEYGRLNEKYYGPRVITDDRIRTEWARIPHFYMNFYVY